AEADTRVYRVDTSDPQVRSSMCRVHPTRPENHASACKTRGSKPAASPVSVRIRRFESRRALGEDGGEGGIPGLEFGGVGLERVSHFADVTVFQRIVEVGHGCSSG